MGYSDTTLMVKPKPIQFRGQIPPHIDFVVRAIAPLKNSGRDWNLSDVATEALVDWLKKPENKALIEKHKILEALDDKGLEAPKNWLGK